MERTEVPSPEAQRRQMIDRQAAIEAATKEELQNALVRVEKLLQETPDDPVIQGLVKDLEKKIAGKTPETTPDTIH